MAKVGRKKLKKSEKRLNKSVTMHPKLVKKVLSQYDNFSEGISKIVEYFYSDKE